ncbi:MAG: hypothetical protein AAFP97_05355 [Pseudomonadota bacterium]
MRDFLSHVRLHATQQIRRHLNSPFVWILAIAGPIGARYMVPEEGADHALISVNNAVLEQSASVIGLQLGVIVAVLFTPLAYIFLRAGPTRIQPRQVTDVVPRSRPALSFGRWLGDTSVLCGLLFILAVAGIALSYFRLPFEDTQPIETLVATMIVAAPAMAVIAAIRNIFIMRPGLRGAGGDVAFFFVWLMGLTLSAAFFMDGTGNNAMADLFGFAAPLATGASEPVHSLAIGGAPITGRIIEFDGMAGVTHPDYLGSRLFWIMVSGLAVFGAGYLFKPGKPKRVKNRQPAHRGPAQFSSERLSPILPKGRGWIVQLVANLRELAKPYWLLALIGAAGFAGLFLPLRGMVGPALALLLIFPMTLYGARWREKSTDAWLGTLPTHTLPRVVVRLLAAILFAVIALLPSILTLQAGQWGDILAIGMGIPIIALGLGYLTRGPVAARLALLILWYGYLNL